MAIRYSVAILAGGQSTRMGRDKALLRLEGVRFIDRLARQFRDCPDAFISAARPGDYADAGLPVVADENRGIGPIEGIRQALVHAREGCVFVCAVDMPYITRATADYLAEFVCSDYDAWAFTAAGRVHPLCAIYRKAALPAVEGLIERGNYRLGGILSAVRTKYVRLEDSRFDGRVLSNVNTPGAYRALGGPAVFCVSGVKDSGKTTLVEGLIGECLRAGLSVGAIKHDGHDFNCDAGETDSHRLYAAGADRVAVFSPRQAFVHIRGEVGVEALLARMAGLDVVIIEGLKASGWPKVEVVRGAVSRAPVCGPETLVCVASDVLRPGDVSCPVYDINDVHGIFCRVMDRLSEGQP